MKKKAIFFIGLLLLLLIGLNTLSQFSRKGGPPLIPSPIPTPTSISIPRATKTPLSPLSIVSTKPEDKAVNVPLNQEIIVSFNRSFSLNEIIFSIAPTLPYSIRAGSNNLIIKPSQLFSPGVLYTYIIKYKSVNQLPRTRSFTTIGPTQPFLPDTAPSGFFEEEENFQRQNHPDIFLSNKTPYSTSDFSIASDFKQTPVGHFYFMVTLKGENKEISKSNFINWLRSLSLTNDQIQNLDIAYQ